MINKQKFTDRLDGIEDRDAGFMLYFGKDGSIDRFELRNGSEMVQLYTDMAPKLYVHKREEQVNYEVRWDASGAITQEGVRNYTTIYK
jgi:hypothetical protein